MAKPSPDGRKIFLRLIDGFLPLNRFALLVNSILLCQSCVTFMPPPQTINQNFSKFTNISLALNFQNSIVGDFYYPTRSTILPPLVIISHGNFSQKEAHANQCETLAMQHVACLAIQLSNSKEWPANGIRISKLVKLLYQQPEVLPSPVNRHKIILVGHSFGGSAVSIASSLDAPIIGTILLDPALVRKSVTSNLNIIHTPVFLLGADRKIYSARDRALFSRNILGEFGELSIRGSTHNDAQDPSLYSLQSFGLDPFSHNDKRVIFTKLLTAAVLSLSKTGSFESFASNIRTFKNVTLEKYRPSAGF